MKLNVVRSMYDWVLKWAEKPSAGYALFVLAFAESSFFPIPPDVLLIPLVLGYRKKWFHLALLTTIASALGGIFGYGIGHWLWWSGHASQMQFSGLAEFFFRVIPGFSKEVFEQMRVKYELYNFWIVFTAGFTPIPYKLITISAGAFNVDFIIFCIASIISRGARFFMLAALIRIFGEPIRTFIDKYFNLLAVLFTILLIGGFIVLKHFM